jgi:hypothetical protein
MNGCNQTRFTTTNVENGQFSDLVSAGKDRAQLNKRTKLILFSSIYTNAGAQTWHQDASLQTHSTVSV